MPSPIIISQHFIPHEKPYSVWETLLDRLPKYSYFQTPAWSRLLEKSNEKWKPAHRYISFDDGVECILPCFAEQKRFGFHKLEALPWGTYGSPVGEHLNAAHFYAIAKSLLTFRQPIVHFHVHPSLFGGLDIKKTNANRTDSLYTHILHLNQPFDELETQRFQPRLRTTIRKAAQAGVKVHWSNSKEALETFKKLYQSACERWDGELAVPLHFFDRLVDLSENEARVWFAEYQGTTIAADVMLYGKQEVQYFTGAMDGEYVHLNAPKLLMRQIIQDACERNYGLINFGASAGLEGVEQFKERFGGIKSYYARLRYHHFFFRFIR